MVHHKLGSRGRLAALEAAGLRGTAGWPELDVLCSVVANVLHVSIVIVSVIDHGQQLFKGAHGLPEPLRSRRSASAILPFCSEIASTHRPLLVQDATRGRRTLADGDDDGLDVAAYAGVPIMTEDGSCVAVLAAINARPRVWTVHDIAALRGFADAIVTILDRRRLVRRCAQLEDTLAHADAAMHMLIPLAPASRALSDEAEPLRHLLAAVAERTQWPCVELVTHAGGQLRSHAWFASEPWRDGFRAAAPWPLAEDSLVAGAFRTGRPVAMTDLARQSGYCRAHAAAEHGLASGCAVPLIHAGEPVGALVLFTPAVRPDLHEVKTLVPRIAASVAGQVARMLDARPATPPGELPLHDELTGLLNRRGFYAVGEQQLVIAHRQQQQVLLVLLDIDGLKQANEDGGRAAGDARLRAVADAVRATFRAADVMGRLGGDELVVLSLGAAGTNLDVIRARMTDELGKAAIGHAGDAPLSCSLSVASFDPAQPKTLDTLILEADLRMRAVKRSAVAPPPAA